MSAANVEVLRDSVTGALDQLQRAASPVIKKSKSQARNLVDQGSDLVETMSNEASEAAGEIANRLIAYTKKKPITALLLAVGAGALLLSASRSIRSGR